MLEITSKPCTSNESSSVNESSQEMVCELDGLTAYYTKYKHCLKVAHININSVRHKFDPLREALSKGIIDVLFTQKTKLDESFPKKQFKVEGFKDYRLDCTDRMGGIMAHIREDITHKRRDDLEVNIDNNGRIEMMVFEMNIKSETWLFTSLYKQPKVQNSVFCDVLEAHISKCNSVCPNVIIVGDINVDLLKQGTCVNNILDISGFKNIVNEPTCFKSINPTSIDVVLSNVYKRLQGTMCYETGLSDFHKMIIFSTKLHVPNNKPKKVTYRSYKNYNEDDYINDLTTAPFHVGEIFDSVDDSYWFCEYLLKDIIDHHAPLKSKTVRHMQVPYMNGKLRKAINYKNMLRRKFEKSKSKAKWEEYRKQRNVVVSLRKKSMSFYLKNKCTVTKDNKKFWSAVKPLISDKCKSGQENIILSENNVILNDPSSVCDVLNDFYNNIASGIGPDPSNSINYQNDDDLDVYINDVLQRYDNHESIQRIRDGQDDTNKFTFQKIDVNNICKRLSKLVSNKATGHDGVPPKLLKAGAKVLCYPLLHLVNKCIEQSIFPSSLKKAEITPIFKKGDCLQKENYRPVSVLSCISKIFEGVLVDQLSQYFEDFHMSPYISGFRKHHDCQNVLLRFNECIKSHLDNNEVAGAVLTDLSKAFDCLPHDLLLCKFYNYGVDTHSCKLIASYFKDRYHRVKLVGHKSEWLLPKKGAPQGSHFGPFAYNVHTNDLIMLMATLCDVFNYADDNTICCYGKTVDTVKQDLQSKIMYMTEWFKSNEMKVNVDKFQMILFDKRGSNSDDFITSDNCTITNQQSVKLLGVTFDYSLTFDVHITEICRKPGRKLNVLSRLSKSLDIESKLILLHSFVLSHFQYCSVVWHFCSKENMNKIENIQKQALRYVFNDYQSSYSELRSKTSLPLLYVKRLQSILNIVYKCVNKVCSKYVCDLFSINEGSRSNRKVCQLRQIKFNSIKYGFNSVRYQGSKLWNILDPSFNDPDCFKTWEPQCSCSYCDLCILSQM